MKAEELTDNAIEYILREVNTDRCTPWERSFLESIADQWERTHSLSDKQKEVLGKIWDKQP